MILKKNIPNSKTQRILYFLSKNPEHAFKAIQIADLVFNDLKEVSKVRSLLHNLKEQGIIYHKRPYWGINNEASK